jgi:hypothetical protein
MPKEMQESIMVVCFALEYTFCFISSAPCLLCISHIRLLNCVGWCTQPLPVQVVSLSGPQHVFREVTHCVQSWRCRTCEM